MPDNPKDPPATNSDAQSQQPAPVSIIKPLDINPSNPPTIKSDKAMQTSVDVKSVIDSLMNKRDD